MDILYAILFSISVGISSYFLWLWGFQNNCQMRDGKWRLVATHLVFQTSAFVFLLAQQHILDDVYRVMFS